MGDITLIENDIQVSQFGDISLVLGDDDILQQAWNNIHTIRGEMINHPDVGNDVYNNRIKVGEDLSNIERYCEDAVLCDSRIDTVESLVVTRSSVVGMVDIAFIVITTDGNRLSSNRKISIT